MVKQREIAEISMVNELIKKKEQVYKMNKSAWGINIDYIKGITFGWMSEGAFKGRSDLMNERTNSIYTSTCRSSRYVSINTH